jgi:uncharacterized membrane protein
MEKWMVFEKYLFLFFVGGSAYYCLEIILRGFSHYSMFLCGGICFLGCGLLDEFEKFKLNLLMQMCLSALLITGVEFITGCIVNVWLGLKIWDYSGMPYNLKGQICPQYSMLWFFLSFAAIRFDDYLRCQFFGEKSYAVKMHGQ